MAKSLMRHDELARDTPVSEFTGTPKMLIWTTIAFYGISLLSLGILSPIALCYRDGYIIDNTVIDGKKMKFKGNPIELWQKCMIWFLLCFVTLGIYLLLSPGKIRKWFIENTHIENE